MAVLMKDVAKKVGVSLSTVSHVLSGKRRFSISKETRERVLRAARELDYQPNVNAQRLATRSANVFGLIVSEIANPFFPEMINSFESSAAKSGFEILLCNTEYEEERSQSAVQNLIGSKIRGVAIMTSKFNLELVRQFAGHQIPAVLFNHDRSDAAPGRIELDFASGLRQCFDHLIGLGHKSFAVITGPADIPSARHFTDNATRFAAEAGVEFQNVIECNYRHDGGMAAIRTLLMQSRIPTAILCANDLIALGAISVLEQAGIRVPRHVSVVGMDDILYARLASPPLTTVALPRVEIGKVAFDMLYRMQKSKRPKPETKRVSTYLVVRRSTAKAATSPVVAAEISKT